jgi:hypothetical protein
VDVNITDSFTSSGTYPTAPVSKNDPYGWAREFIRLKTSKSNGVSSFYKSCLRFLIAELGNLIYLNSENQVIDVACIYANPERTIAKLKQENNIILPIISISQETTNNDEDRRRTSTTLINNKWWDDEKKRAFRVLSIAPRAVTIVYSINIWAKYRSDLDQLLEQVRLLFNPALTIITSHTTTSKAFLVDEDDNSNVETADREDRLLRRSISVELEGYIPNPKFLVTATGEIEEFNIDARLY